MTRNNFKSTQSEAFKPKNTVSPVKHDPVSTGSLYKVDEISKSKD